MPDDEIMTIEEVADFLKLKPQTVYKWAQEGTIPSAKLGKEWRFRRSILDTWINQSILLSKGGFDVMFRSSAIEAKKSNLSPEEIERVLKEALD